MPHIEIMKFFQNHWSKSISLFRFQNEAWLNVQFILLIFQSMSKYNQRHLNLPFLKLSIQGQFLFCCQVLNHYVVCTALPNELSVNKVSAMRKKREGDKRFAIPPTSYSLLLTIPPWSCPLLFYGSLKSRPARSKTWRLGLKLTKRKYMRRDLSFFAVVHLPPPFPTLSPISWTVQAIHLINRENKQ